MVTKTTILRIKKTAKRYAKGSQIPHHLALEQAAKEEGFKSYHEAISGSMAAMFSPLKETPDTPVIRIDECSPGTRALIRAEQAIRLGARPMVASAVSGLAMRTVHRMYRAITGNLPPNSPLPGSSPWFLSTAERKVQAAKIATISKRMFAHDRTSHANPYVATYEEYKRQLKGNAEFSFDLVFAYIRLMNQPVSG